MFENSLLPELTILEEEFNRNGEEVFLEKYLQLTYIVEHYDSTRKEVTAWIHQKKRVNENLKSFGLT